MADFKPIIKTQGASIPVDDGQFVVDVQNGEMFLDYANNRIPIGGGSSELPKFFYECTGVADDVAVSNISKDFYNPAVGSVWYGVNKLELFVHGNFGFSASPQYTAAIQWESTLNIARCIELGLNEIDDGSNPKELVVNFYNCTFPSLTEQQMNPLPVFLYSFNGLAVIAKTTNSVTVKGMRIGITLNASSSDSKKIIGFLGNGVWEDCASFFRNGNPTGYTYFYSFVDSLDNSGALYKNCKSKIIHTAGYGISSYGFCSNGATYINCENNNIITASQGEVRAAGFSGIYLDSSNFTGMTMGKSKIYNCKARNDINITTPATIIAYGVLGGNIVDGGEYFSNVKAAGGQIDIVHGISGTEIVTGGAKGYAYVDRNGYFNGSVVGIYAGTTRPDFGYNITKWINCEAWAGSISGYNTGLTVPFAYTDSNTNAALIMSDCTAVKNSIYTYWNMDNAVYLAGGMGGKSINNITVDIQYYNTSISSANVANFYFVIAEREIK